MLQYTVERNKWQGRSRRHTRLL